LLVCGYGVAGGGMGERELYGSVNAGASWTRLTDPGSGTGYDTDGVADGGGGHAAIATGNNGGGGLLVTTDYAESWVLRLEFPGGGAFRDLAFQDEANAVAVRNPYDDVYGQNVPTGTGILYRTTDGGADWSKVRF
jgi:hypothetical protein